MHHLLYACFNQYGSLSTTQGCCTIQQAPQYYAQEPIYSYSNDYSQLRHKFKGVKTISKTKAILEPQDFITEDEDLSCPNLENCKWTNDPNDELDWIVINQENMYSKNIFPKKFLQNGYEFLLLSTDEKPAMASGMLISNPINCQNTYGYLSFKCYISDPKDIGTPPILEICIKIINQNYLTNCQRVFTNPNYYVHTKIPEVSMPFSIVIKASKFDNPVEGGLVAIHELKYEIGKEGNINSCEMSYPIDNKLSYNSEITPIAENNDLSKLENNIIDQELTSNDDLNKRIYPVSKQKEAAKSNTVFESKDFENVSVDRNDKSLFNVDDIKKINLLKEFDNNIVDSLPISSSENKNMVSIEYSYMNESKMSCEVIKCSPERLGKETNCLYNNYIINIDGEESLGSGWEVVLVNDFSPHEYLKKNYYKSNKITENLFLTANFYGVDSPTYIFESPNINFDDSEEFYISFQRHISFKGVELVVCGHKNGSDCFWSSEGDDLKDEWIIEHVPLIPGLSNIVFIAKGNHNISPQTIGQVGLFDIKMYIKKNDSLVLYC
uniref:MAM domain-containing protein n=1 Tax=Parastrongyloides trichosuri TaxID=131310 RepID=A0A0N4Z9M1_PARTI